MGETNYFLISFFEHRDAVEVEFERREIRENRVRKPYRRDSIELETV